MIAWGFVSLTRQWKRTRCVNKNTWIRGVRPGLPKPDLPKWVNTIKHTNCRNAIFEIVFRQFGFRQSGWPRSEYYRVSMSQAKAVTTINVKELVLCMNEPIIKSTEADLNCRWRACQLVSSRILAGLVRKDIQPPKTRSNIPMDRLIVTKRDFLVNGSVNMTNR